MDWTWSKVNSLALVRSGILGRGQVANASMQNDAIDAANLLLDEWDGEGLALPDLYISITFNTVAGTARYSLGTTDPIVPRPETILTATLTINTNPVQRVQMVEMSMQQYTLLPIPSTQSLPFQWAFNPKWPTADLYLYPTPDRVYPVDLNCKMKWQTTITTPDINPFAIASVPSGYANALVDNIALKLAQNYRMETPTLVNNASSSKFTLAQNVIHEYARRHEVPMGIYSDVIIKSGMNP